MDQIRIGTRGSRLALRQAALVQEALSRADAGIRTELVILSTSGDRIQDRPLSEIGDKGVFASELEQALLFGQIDLAVHSAKDLPMTLAEGLTIAAVLPRADVRDVLVVPRGGRTPVFRRCGGAREMTNADVAGQFGVVPESAERKTKVFSDFPGQFCVGTGSRRRQLLAEKVWENVVCREIRGNVDTRLRKLKEGGYDGIILAKAGLDRLGVTPDVERDFDFYPLSPELFLPAACQGIIAVEAVEGTETVEICTRITDEETALCFLVEREVLTRLSADCSEAAAAWCRLERTARDSLLLDVMYADRRANLTGMVNTEDGRRLAREAARAVKEPGMVYLAGGGCGDAGLLTLKALKALQSCDTVVYDSLVSEELLQWTKPECEKIYVGKRYGCHNREQLEINSLLIKKAREGKTVVRLKGGDPYVFGRGGEEFLAVRDAGIYCEEIPGITSAIAVPAAAGIPVTHRGLSDSVTVVTGTAAGTDGQAKLKMDFRALSQLNGTLVILMGMHHLVQIVMGLLAAGKDQNTPCAIIMEGTTERQRVVRAPLFELVARAAKQGITSPAVIVIGAVTKLSLTAETESYANREKPDTLSMAGITVGVTGTAHFVGRVSAALRKKGADVWDMSFMEIVPAESALPDFADYGWLVFTSPNGVQVFLEKMRRERRDLRTLSDKKIAVIGPGTAGALQEAGIYADYMPEVYDSEHLAEGLSDIIVHKPRPVILLRAGQGSDILPRTFRERGIAYEECSLYELGVQEEKRDEVIAKAPDYIVFGSAMGAGAYFEGLEKNGLQNTRSRFVCIGERCANEVRKYAAKPPLIAEESSVAAIAEFLCGHSPQNED